MWIVGHAFNYIFLQNHSIRNAADVDLEWGSSITKSFARQWPHVFTKATFLKVSSWHSGSIFIYKINIALCRHWKVHVGILTFLLIYSKFDEFLFQHFVHTPKCYGFLGVANSTGSPFKLSQYLLFNAQQIMNITIIMKNFTYLLFNCPEIAARTIYLFVMARVLAHKTDKYLFRNSTSKFRRLRSFCGNAHSASITHTHTQSACLSTAQSRFNFKPVERQTTSTLSVRSILCSDLDCVTHSQ